MLDGSNPYTTDKLSPDGHFWVNPYFIHQWNLFPWGIFHGVPQLATILESSVIYWIRTNFSPCSSTLSALSEKQWGNSGNHSLLFLSEQINLENMTFIPSDWYLEFFISFWVIITGNTPFQYKSSVCTWDVLSFSVLSV